MQITLFFSLLQWLLIIVALCTLLSSTARLWWVAEIVGQFRPQLGITGLLLGLIFLLSGEFLPGISGVLLAAVHLNYLIPLYVRSRTDVPGASERCRILYANLLVTNTSFDRTVELVRQATADILVFIEMPAEGYRELEEELGNYPIRAHGIYRGTTYGAAVFSKKPLRNIRINNVEDRHAPVLSADYSAGDRTITIHAVHLLTPTSAEWFRLRNECLRSLTTMVAGEEVIVVGDFNMSTWSPAFMEFAAATKLRDARKGFGMTYTWPTLFPMIGIPLDHCLISPSIVVENFQRGGRIGSDHFPLIIDLNMPK